MDKNQSKRTVRVHPAPPTSLIQEIPTPDTAQVVDTLIGEAGTLREQGRGDILSDVLGSYTGTAAHDERPEQDPDDL